MKLLDFRQGGLELLNGSTGGHRIVVRKSFDFDRQVRKPQPQVFVFRVPAQSSGTTEIRAKLLHSFSGFVFALFPQLVLAAQERGINLLQLVLQFGAI